MMESLDDRLPAAAEEDPHTRRPPCCPPASLCGIARASCFAIGADVLGSGLLWRGLATPCAVLRARSTTPCVVWRARTEEEAGTDPATERPCDPCSPAATCAQQARVRRGRCGGCKGRGWETHASHCVCPLTVETEAPSSILAYSVRLLPPGQAPPASLLPKLRAPIARTTGFF